jgi:hypothetical protein
MVRYTQSGGEDPRFTIAQLSNRFNKISTSENKDFNASFKKHLNEPKKRIKISYTTESDDYFGYNKIIAVGSSDNLVDLKYTLSKSTPDYTKLSDKHIISGLITKKNTDTGTDTSFDLFNKPIINIFRNIISVTDGNELDRVVNILISKFNLGSVDLKVDESLETFIYSIKSMITWDSFNMNKPAVGGFNDWVNIIHSIFYYEPDSSNTHLQHVLVLEMFPLFDALFQPTSNRVTQSKFESELFNNIGNISDNKSIISQFEQNVSNNKRTVGVNFEIVITILTEFKKMCKPDVQSQIDTIIKYFGKSASFIFNKKNDIKEQLKKNTLNKDSLIKNYIADILQHSMSQNRINNNKSKNNIIGGMVQWDTYKKRTLFILYNIAVVYMQNIKLVNKSLISRISENNKKISYSNIERMKNKLDNTLKLLAEHRLNTSGIYKIDKKYRKIVHDKIVNEYNRYVIDYQNKYKIRLEKVKILNRTNLKSISDLNTVNVNYILSKTYIYTYVKLFIIIYDKYNKDNSSTYNDIFKASILMSFDRLQSFNSDKTIKTLIHTYKQINGNYNISHNLNSNAGIVTTNQVLNGTDKIVTKQFWEKVKFKLKKHVFVLFKHRHEYKLFNILHFAITGKTHIIPFYQLYNLRIKHSKVEKETPVYILIANTIMQKRLPTQWKYHKGDFYNTVRTQTTEDGGENNDIVTKTSLFFTDVHKTKESSQKQKRIKMYNLIVDPVVFTSGLSTTLDNTQIIQALRSKYMSQMLISRIELVDKISEINNVVFQ